MKQLAQLIVKAIAQLDPVVAGAGCGCDIPHDFDMTGTRQVFEDLAAQFDFDPARFSEIAPGKCSVGVLEALVQAWGDRNGVPVYNVWVYDGAIALHHVPADHPLYAELRELTTQEVCDSREIERRVNACKQA